MKRAFTLLELILVIAIIAVLAGIIVMVLNPAEKLGRINNSKRKSDVDSIKSAINQYVIDSGGREFNLSMCENTICEICSTRDSGTCTTSNKLNITELIGTQLSMIPLDPRESSRGENGTGYFVSKVGDKVKVMALGAELGEEISSDGVSRGIVSSPMFTSAMAMRNAPGPFAGAPIVQSKWSDASAGDNIYINSMSVISGNFRNVFDGYQGSIVLWVTPEWNGNDGLRHYFFVEHANGGIRFYKNTNNYLYLDVQGKTVTTDISSWIAGNTYSLVARWDTKNTLDGTNYLSLSVNDSHTFGSAIASSSIGGGNYGIGTENIALQRYIAQSIIEGFTIYRRPLYDGQYGIDVGNGDEINQIYNSGTGKDPTLITGSWDVVFALPTNSTTGTLTTGTGHAWSHPYLSNLLYTSATNTGGFMMNGNMASDGWAEEGAVANNDAIHFNGSNSTVNVGSTSSLDDLHSGEFTVEGWIRYDTPVGTSRAIIAKYDYNNKNGWAVFASSINSISGTLGCGTNANVNANTGTNSISDYRWHHFVMYYNNSTDRKVYLALDGAWAASPSLACTSPINTDTSLDMYVGRLSTPSIWFWQGGTGWLRISNNARYTPGINFTPPSRWSPPSGDGNTVAQWNMEEGTGTSVTNDGGASSCGGTPANCDGVLSNGIWNDGGALATNQKIFSGGYKFTSNAANQGIYYDKTVTGGNDFVIRALAHSDGTCVPRVTLYDQTGGAEIGHLDGTATSTRTAPNNILFTGEIPGSGSKTLRVKLTNTASSGTCYWHQVEVYSNLNNNPSMETGSGDPWIPTGYTNQGFAAGQTIQENTIIHSGSSSLKFNTFGFNKEIYNVPSLTNGRFYSVGLFGYGQIGVGGDVNPGVYFLQSNPLTDVGPYGVAGEWRHLPSVMRVRWAGAWQEWKPTNSPAYMDDVYLVALNDVTLTVTAANEANSTETTGLRIDGNDTYTKPISTILNVKGSIEMDITPRHSFNVADKFGLTNPVIVHLYIDANNNIKLYKESATLLRLTGIWEGQSINGDWANPVLNAGTKYNIKMTYESSTNLKLIVDGVERISTPLGGKKFGINPTGLLYIGSDNTGSNQYDLTVDTNTISFKVV